MIEVLVALAIVSIGLLAAIRAAGQGTSAADELRGRLLAGWVAENLLAEQRATRAWPAPGIQRGIATQAGTAYAWRMEVTTTPNSAFRRVDVFVFASPEETHVLRHHTGFVVNAPGVAR